MRNSAYRLSGCLGVALALLVSAYALLAQPAGTLFGEKEDKVAPFLEEFGRGQSPPRTLPPFLEEFQAHAATKLETREVRFPSAGGAVQAFSARPAGAGPLPAVLLAYDEPAWTEWMKENTREVASIGYDALLMYLQPSERLPPAKVTSTDERALAQLQGAVRWFRTRPDVVPNRLGVVGWGWSGGQTLALAAASSLQACVVCDVRWPREIGFAAGLRHTPVLGVFAGASSRDELSTFRRLLDAHKIPGKFHVDNQATSGFMGPPITKAYAHDAAENAWVAIYNFLEKHVEDARPAELANRLPMNAVATIADMMRAVNEPTGLRGSLSRALEREPRTEKQWNRIRADAAFIAEAGGWLQTRLPPKGPEAHWQEQARAYASAAVAIVDAADRRDYAAARQGLTRLAGQCAACHEHHR